MKMKETLPVPNRRSNKKVMDANRSRANCAMDLCFSLVKQMRADPPKVIVNRPPPDKLLMLVNEELKSQDYKHGDRFTIGYKVVDKQLKFYLTRESPR